MKIQKTMLMMMAVASVTLGACDKDDDEATIEPKVAETAYFHIAPSYLESADMAAEEVRKHYQNKVGNDATVTLENTEYYQGVASYTYKVETAASKQTSTHKNLLGAIADTVSLAKILPEHYWVAQFKAVGNVSDTMLEQATWGASPNVLAGTWTFTLDGKEYTVEVAEERMNYQANYNFLTGASELDYENAYTLTGNGLNHSGVLECSEKVGALIFTEKDAAYLEDVALGISDIETTGFAFGFRLSETKSSTQAQVAFLVVNNKYMFNEDVEVLMTRKK